MVFLRLIILVGALFSAVSPAARSMRYGNNRVSSGRPKSGSGDSTPLAPRPASVPTLPSNEASRPPLRSGSEKPFRAGDVKSNLPSDLACLPDESRVPRSVSRDGYTPIPRRVVVTRKSLGGFMTTTEIKSVIAYWLDEKNLKRRLSADPSPSAAPGVDPLPSALSAAPPVSSQFIKVPSPQRPSPQNLGSGAAASTAPVSGFPQQPAPSAPPEEQFQDPSVVTHKDSGQTVSIFASDPRALFASDPRAFGLQQSALPAGPYTNIEAPLPESATASTAPVLEPQLREVAVPPAQALAPNPTAQVKVSSAAAPQAPAAPQPRGRRLRSVDSGACLVGPVPNFSQHSPLRSQPSAPQKPPKLADQRRASFGDKTPRDRTEVVPLPVASPVKLPVRRSKPDQHSQSLDLNAPQSVNPQSASGFQEAEASNSKLDKGDNSSRRQGSDVDDNSKGLLGRPKAATQLITPKTILIATACLGATVSVVGVVYWFQKEYKKYGASQVKNPTKESFYEYLLRIYVPAVFVQ